MADAEANGKQRLPETGEPLLTLGDIQQSFGDVAVLDGISFEVPPGTVTAVVGPNGSGKTTLSKIIAGLLRPSGGTVSLEADAERPVGYLPQNPQFRPVFTVEETLQFYADLLTAAEDPETTMERVGLAGVGDRRVGALSGGMRRLLGLAQSFLGSPPLVVLDEPTSGLDPRMTRQIFDVITDSADRDTSILLTTHDLSYAPAADSVLVLNRGRLVARGSPDELLARTNADSLPDAFFSIVGEEPAVQAGIEGDRS